MARDTVVVAIASIVVAMAVIFREKVIASRFGIGDVTDAFALASSTIVFLTTAIGGSLALSLIPAMMRAEAERGRDAAEDLCRATDGSRAR